MRATVATILCILQNAVIATLAYTCGFGVFARGGILEGVADAWAGLLVGLPLSTAVACAVAKRRYFVLATFSWIVYWAAMESVTHNDFDWHYTYVPLALSLALCLFVALSATGADHLSRRIARRSLPANP
jgi:hypothetical protein